MGIFFSIAIMMNYFDVFSDDPWLNAFSLFLIALSQIPSHIVQQTFYSKTNQQLQERADQPGGYLEDFTRRLPSIVSIFGTLFAVCSFRNEGESQDFASSLEY